MAQKLDPRKDLSMRVIASDMPSWQVYLVFAEIGKKTDIEFGVAETGRHLQLFS